MNKLAKVNQLLDDYLFGNMSTNDMRKVYNEILQPAYNKLTYRDKSKVFHQSDNFKGIVSANGEVGFQRNIPGYGYSFDSPLEILNSGYYDMSQFDDLVKAAKAPQPTRELIQMNRAFQDYSKSPEGSRLYYNLPTSEHRAKAYEKIGFQVLPKSDFVDAETAQYLDTRPYADNETFNKLYAVGDLNNYGVDNAQFLLEQRGKRLPSGSRVANLQNALNDFKPYNMPLNPSSDFDAFAELDNIMARQAAARQSSSTPTSWEHYFSPDYRGQRIASAFGLDNGNYEIYIPDQPPLVLPETEARVMFQRFMNSPDWNGEWPMEFHNY